MKEVSKIFTILGNSTRLAIVQYLSSNGESVCADISKGLNLAQPTMCHHYKKLEQVGLIAIRKEKTTNFYDLNIKLLDRLGLDIKKISQYESFLS